jgi:hypothetical protein
LVVIVILSSLLVSNVSAVEELTEHRKPAPGAALAAAALNVVFMPMRLAVTVLFAELGGLTGFLNGGDEQAANDVWNLVGGGNFITPGFIQGKEPMHLDSYHEVRRIPPPSRGESFGFPFEPAPSRDESLSFPFAPAIPGGRDAD